MFLNKFFLITLTLILTTGRISIAEQNDSVDLSTRNKEIQSALDAGKGKAKLWWDGWTAFYTGAAVVSFGFAGLSDDKTLKITQTVAGVESLIGIGGLLIFPFPAKNGAEKLERMPENTYEEQTAKLKEGEKLLRRAAEAEKAGQSWLQHTLAFLVNLSGSVVIWKVYDKEISENGDNPLTQALINLGLGTALAELQIWTQPTKAIKDWVKYKNRYSLSLLPAPNGTIMIAEVRF